MRLARSHLTEGGILAFNDTGSPDADKTAAAVFPFVFKYRSFVIASERDLSLQQTAFRQRLATLNWSGTPLFRAEDKDVEQKIESMHAGLSPFVEADASLKARRQLRVITEQNMIPEYRYGAYYQGLFLRGWP
jgi:hypothetical protein